MFSLNSTYKYIFTVSLILLASYFGGHIKAAFTDHNDEHELIKKYLLHDSPLYGHERPKLWIHSKYEINARKWKSFQSRNTTDLNQPYIHLTVKTIINHCGDDFNICLIDDETFSKLIPGWDIDVTKVAEPIKSRYRELGMIELIYIYGGMTIPNSFVCMKNLFPLYEMATQNDKPFICENVNRHTNLAFDKHKRIFTPDSSIIGAKKKNPELRLMADYLKTRNQNPHFSSDVEFLGYTSEWCIGRIRSGSMNLVGGEYIGIKTTDGRPVLLEDIMEEKPLDICPTRNFGILIPREEILSRVKYQWFATMSSQELLTTNLIIVKYILSSMNSILEHGSSIQHEKKHSTILI
jgi:hypothetical protein